MRFVRRVSGIRVLAVAAALAASALAASGVFGSSHREAPSLQNAPEWDDTDTYAFVSPDKPNTVTLTGGWVPFEGSSLPNGGPIFYKFDPNAEYYINVDNTGDGVYDVRYKFNFTTHYRKPNSNLFALPGVSSFSDPKLQIVQTYDVAREQYQGGELKSSTVLARGLPVAPSNAGPKTFPNYDAVAGAAISTLPGGGKVFAGQRDDPFFIDLAAAFDGLHLRSGTGNQGGGRDTVAGYNIQAIVLQVPKSELTRDGHPVSGANASNANIGVWTDVEVPGMQVRPGRAGKAGRESAEEDVQVSRLGNPLVNELLIPVPLKDTFNASQPSTDAQKFGQYVVKPEPARVLNALFGLGIKETNRTDIVTALLTGIPGFTQIGSNPAAADTLKLNMGVPPNPTPNRFGVIGGDQAGYPNGRRFSDDVVDITLRVVGGFLVPANEGGKKLPLGDGVDRNDAEMLPAFPYEAAPHNGFDSVPGRNEPGHSPTPGDLMPPAP